ncbi:MAG TPA: M1 family aminopeptidase [Pyrinomonadaceae bacterium]|nr:M1 family aminopeptidase [Pyrinomonadaceae bacterium]
MRARITLALLLLLAFATLGVRAQPEQQQTPETPAVSGPEADSQQQQQEEEEDATPSRYEINLALDFDNRTYTGTERVQWTNDSDRAAYVLYFHLYSNMRAAATTQRPTPSPTPTASRSPSEGPGSQGAATTLTAAAAASASPAPDEPRIEVTEVSAVGTGAPLLFALDDQATTLRVNLREPVMKGRAVEVEIKFKGSVPEIDPEETGLVVHVLQQVGAALRSEREVRRARDLNFRCRGQMLLGTAYPVLAARDGDDWQRKVEMSIGDMVYTEAADYRVTVDAPPDVKLFASGEIAPPPPISTTARPSGEAGNLRAFTGDRLRDFALVAGRGLRSEERLVGETRVRSVYAAEHEIVGRRVLVQTADAVRVYTARFGPLPYKTINVVDTPLVAGLGSAEFTGLGAIASAFYVDFDSALVRNLPEIIREQRASVEDSLEWTVAHVVAHQWWGKVVGNDPERDPVLDEALANWSALLYYRDVHSEERAAAVMEDQLRGVYKVYRTFGGEDMAADRNAREYRNSFQYLAIVSSKGALMFAELRRLLGHQKFFAALRNYYNANMYEIAGMDDLRGAFVAEARLLQRRAVTRTFNRWLSGKRGDEDIAPPDPQMAAALGINPNINRSNEGNRFARLGKFFWQQMTRIR